MRKYLAIVAMVPGLFMGCGDDDESDFPIEPHIEFRDLTFAEGARMTDPDTLNLSINFQDGDMDLGLSDTTISDPYHPWNYFLEDGNGNLTPVSTYRKYSDLGSFIKLKSNQVGTLATVRTRTNPLYANMPDYTCPFSAMNYLTTSWDGYLNVSEEDGRIIGNDILSIDTLTQNGFPDVYRPRDTFYTEANPNHFNITVQFMVQNPNGSFSEFNWKTELCSSLDMSGRFPNLTSLARNNVLANGSFRITGISTKEGILTYSMTSTGFVPLFRDKKLKLLVTIKDRALHTSNTIETSVIEF